MPVVVDSGGASAEVKPVYLSASSSRTSGSALTRLAVPVEGEACVDGGIGVTAGELVVFCPLFLLLD